MQNYTVEIMTNKTFNVKANTVEEALDFMLHAQFNSDIIDANSKNTQFVVISCQSDDGVESGDYIAVRNGDHFNVMDISRIPFNE